MSVGRTTFPHTRIYADGLDISGYTRSVGPLIWEYDEVDLTCPPGDNVKGYLPGQPRITPTAINAVLDNDAAGLFASGLKTAGAAVTLMIPIGIRAAPAAGDPCWMGIFQQLNYAAENDGGAMTVSIPFGNWDVASLNAHEEPWGVLLHAKGAETAANTAIGVDSGAQTEGGGYMMYHLFSSNGTVTITAQGASVNTNPSFTNIPGNTSGVVDASITPAYGIAVATTSTIKQYLRWQISLGTATTCTFALGYVRGR